MHQLHITAAMLLLLLTLLSFPHTSRADQKFAIEAEDVTAVLGATITLPCRVVQRHGVLQWTKDDFGLGPHRNLSAFDRYTMTGTDEEGDFTLRIEDAQLEDDGRYQCQVSPGPDGQPGIRSRFVRVTVNAPAEAPRITQGDFLLVTEQKEVVLECVALGGKPAAELSWIDGQGNRITSGIRYTTEPMTDEPGRFVAKSVLRLRVRQLHHNTTVLCRSQNAADRHVKTAEVKLEVKYAPKVTLTMTKSTAMSAAVSPSSNADNDSDNSQSDANKSTKNGAAIDYAVEGHEARFVCAADANPGDITYKWFVNDELVVGDYTTEMVIHNINRSHHMASVKCEATNDIGTAEETLDVQVKYPPIFRHPLRSVEADAREKIKLHCDVDGNPLEIVWVYDPTDRQHHQPRVVGNNATLPLTVSDTTAGRYYCKASVPGFAELQAEAVVYVKRAPRIESPRQQFGARGDSVRLRCAAFSVPKARHVSWSYAGREIQTQHDRDFGVEEEQTVRGVSSTLVIGQAEDWHFGKYNCTVVNDYGVDVMQIELVQQNNVPFLTIVVGATSGVCILVVLVVLVLCVKLRAKRDTRSSKEKEFSADIMPEKHDRCWNNGKNSDGIGSGASSSGDGASSHSSDYKPDIKASSSESDYSIASTNIADSALDFKEMRRQGSVPLAEPIELPLNYRHSVDYADSYYPPKYAPPAHHNNHLHSAHPLSSMTGAAPHPLSSNTSNSYNNSYVTRTDYARYCAPPTSAPGVQSVYTTSPVPHYSPQPQHQQHMPAHLVGQMQMAMAVPMQQQQQQQHHDNGLPGTTRSSLIV